MGAIGAAVASARLLKLNAEQLRHAVGIAASQAGGPRQNFGTDTKPLHAALAARAGVFSAQLAQSGFTANPAILEDPRGFLDVYRGSIASAAQSHGSVFAPGDPFEIVESGITIKPYSCCGCTHSALDALFDLVGEHHLQAAQVQRIECKVNHRAPEVLIHHSAATPLEGKFSVEYCLAVSLIDGTAGLRQFTQARVDDLAVQDLLRRTTMTVDPALPVMEGAFPSEVTLHLDDGRMLTRRVFEARGHRTRPLESEALAAKFIDCAIEAIPADQAHTALAMLMDLQHLRDISALIGALQTH